MGLIGLGVMGRNLALNISDKGHSLSVYNRDASGEEKVVEDFIRDHAEGRVLAGFTNLEAFIDSLASPKKILLMIKAGPVVDQVIDTLLPHLTDADIVIDGGNSYYEDTKRRNEKLAESKVQFVGCGISGGEEGARNGPSIMPGGSPDSYDKISPILESIAAKDKNGKACCTHIGEGGAGHFVKMIHNGIEYAEMQLLAEAYDLMKVAKSNEEIATVFEEWQKGRLSSFLLEITIEILRKKKGEHYLVDMILDQAENKGTGSWSSQTALKLGLPTTMMTEAVFARYVSSFKERRSILGKSINREKKAHIDVKKLENTYRFARILNHQQGMDVITTASETYCWGVDLPSIARIWTGGCIIRSALMEDLIEMLRESSDLLSNQKLLENLTSVESSVAAVISESLTAGIPIPAISSSYQYWLAMTTDRLPANLIQAQRDYFGAHTYKRTDGGDEHFHTNWT